MALSLLIKPHDSGFVWLYFVLIGGVNRKRALQTLLLAVALALPVSHLGIQCRSAIGSARCNQTSRCTPCMAGTPILARHGILLGTHGAPLINLQTALSVLRDDPRFYDLASYLVCGLLLIFWANVVLRSRPTSANAWLAIASVAALSMLPTYHRQQDTRLLLLTIPAFALLWAKRGGDPVARSAGDCRRRLLHRRQHIAASWIPSQKNGCVSRRSPGQILMLLLGTAGPACNSRDRYFLPVRCVRAERERTSGSDDCALAATMHAGPDRCVADVLESHLDGADSPANRDHQT